MAAGDILAVEIGADGWYADVTIEGLGSGGTYNFGLGANNNPATGTPKVVFTVTSLGFDDTGAATTIQRTVYGTKQVRKPYPDEATNQETEDGSDVTVRFALSDYIYAKDQSGLGNSGTDVSVVLLSGLYTESATPSNGFSGTVTNSSTAAYQKVVANWSWPGYQLEDSTTVLRCVAFHRHGQQGRPVRVVKFTNTDGSTTVTQLVTQMTIDAGMNDAVPVPEYQTTADMTAGLTQGAETTKNFIAYPWIGDSDSILDTSTGTAQPTPLYGPIKGVCNRLGTYEQTYAIVSTTGSDAGANTVYPSGSFNEGTAYEFATIGKAAAAIAAYNNSNYGRNDVGAGVIVVKSGSYAWLGSSNTYGNKPKTWLTIRRATGTTLGDVELNSRSGNTDISDVIKLDGIKTNYTSYLFLNIDSLWLDNCALTNTTCFDAGLKAAYLTRSTLNGFGQNLQPVAASHNTTWALVRGNNLNGYKKTILVYTFVGNYKDTVETSPSTLLKYYFNASQVVANSVNSITAFNVIKGFQNNGSNALSMGADYANTHGSAIVQNVFENTYDGVSSLCDIVASGAQAPVNNVIVWHNVFIGERVNIAYNDTGSTALERRYWTIKNNLFASWKIKSDTFTTANANRTGNWPEVFGVGFSGNISGEITGLGASGEFLIEFGGLNTIQPVGTGNPPSGPTNNAPYLIFVDDKSWTGGAATAGNGDYKLQSSSPAKSLAIDYVLPYDLAGNTRTATLTEDAGAYAALHAPAITAQPSSATKNVGESVTFSVTATGNPTPTYQWRKDGDNIVGATSSSYEIESVTEDDAGSYDCVVTNSVGSATSDAAELTVNAAASDRSQRRIRLGLRLGF